MAFLAQNFFPICCIIFLIWDIEVSCLPPYFLTLHKQFPDLPAPPRSHDRQFSQEDFQVHCSIVLTWTTAA